MNTRRKAFSSEGQASCIFFLEKLTVNSLVEMILLSLQTNRNGALWERRPTSRTVVVLHTDASRDKWEKRVDLWLFCFVICDGIIKFLIRYFMAVDKKGVLILKVLINESLDWQSVSFSSLRLLLVYLHEWVGRDITGTT